MALAETATRAPFRGEGDDVKKWIWLRTLHYVRGVRGWGVTMAKSSSDLCCWITPCR